MGVLYLLGASAMFLGVPISGEARRSNLERTTDGFEGLGFGIVYLITALGLFKRNSLARVLAMILVTWNLFGALSNVFSDPGIINLFWLSATIFVPVCLYSGPVRAEFAAAKTVVKAA